MTEEIKKDTVTKKPTKTSMSNASLPICQEAECIGKLTDANHQVTKNHSEEEADDLNRTTRSSMKFGDKDSCSNEECIGKT